MTGAPPLPPLLTLPRAAAAFRVSEKVLRRLASAGALPGAERLAGRWYVRAGPLQRWLDGDDAAPLRTDGTRGQARRG